MAATLALLHSNQDLKVTAQVTAGKSITYNLSPCPGAGQVWPHLLANGVPFGVTLTPQQTALALQAVKDGKTLGVSTHTATNRNQIDFT
jgi:hypothetical protein